MSATPTKRPQMSAAHTDVCNTYGCSEHTQNALRCLQQVPQWPTTCAKNNKHTETPQRYASGANDEKAIQGQAAAMGGYYGVALVSRID